MHCHFDSVNVYSGVLAEDFRWMGPSRYKNVATWQIMKLFKQHVVVEYTDGEGEDHKIDGQFLTIFANQTQHFGKKIRAAPFALVDDGLVDLCLVESTDDMGRGELLSALLLAEKGEHISNPRIVFAKARSVVLTFDHPGVWNVDGEVLKHDGRVEIKCMLRKVPVFANAKAIAGNI
jgi:diacylglycerol kinase family enzyme